MNESRPVEPRTLYIVATPIGNLGDISARALEILGNVDFILCEDTRHSSILLEHFGIHKRVASYFAHNEALRTDQFMPKLLDGESAALITDAGTPGVSDPGSRLVDACLDAGIRVCPVPGACAVPTAVSACGFHQFTSFEFVAFFPRKSQERRDLFQKLANRDSLLIGYESPQRIASLLEDLIAVVGPQRRVCLCRELTKKFESIDRTTAGELLARLNEQPCRGEICLVIEGVVQQEKSAELTQDDIRLIEILQKHGVSARDIRDIVSEYSGAKGRDVYQFIIGK